MRILLIAPSSGRWRGVGLRKLFSGRTFRFSLLSLQSVAAETPAEHYVRIVDEQVSSIPWSERFDLVGITCMTALAPRAYEIADCFRKRGIPVVLGGMHPTLCTDEARTHADAVVAGDAEGVWQALLKDLENGELQAVYQADPNRSLAGLRPPRRDLLDPQRYAPVRAVQATRGCPHKCEFCAVSAFCHGSQRQRPVAEVVAEIRELKSRFIIFVDDNLTADRAYARRLFEALTPLRIKWITQSTLAMADDPEFVELAAQAGCKGVFVGLETFSENNLESVRKGFHRVDEYRQRIEILHRHGIAVEAGIVFGFDGDRPEIFRQTLNRLEELEVDVIQVSIFTPLPGTPRYRQMHHRLTDHSWALYDFHHVVFQPQGMSQKDLQDGHDWITREFYRPWRIARRVWRHLRRPGGLRTVTALTAINLAYYGRVIRWRIRGHNPEIKKNAPVRNLLRTLLKPASLSPTSKMASRQWHHGWRRGFAGAWRLGLGIRRERQTAEINRPSRAG